MPRFLDTNVLLRYFTRDDEDKADRALALLKRVERGEERVVTSPLIIFETVFTLSRFYKVPQEQVRDMVSDIIVLPGVQLPEKSLCLRALDLYCSRNISYADAFTIVTMKARDLSEIYTWDTDFDGVPGLTRLEP